MSEFTGEDGSLPDFLPTDQSELLFPFTYQHQLEEQCRALLPQQEGALRAAVVSQCPTTNEEWAAVGVRGGYAEDAYQSILLSTITNGARDLEVTASMLSSLGQAGDALGERISADLASTIATRTLNTPDARPDAAVNIVEWALGFITDETTQSAAISLVLANKTPAQLTVLVPVLDRLGRPDLVESIDRTLHEHQERLQRQAKAQRHADEARAEEAAQRRAIEERREYIRNNPVQALAEIMEAHGLTDAEEIDHATLTDAGGELLFAAGAIETQTESRSIGATDANVTTLNTARQLLDKAVEMRRAGAQFSNDAYALDRHEDRSVTSANSVDDFWNKLAQLAEWRSEMNPHQVSGLYEEWRDRFIRSRQQERAARILAEHGVDPTDCLPEGFDHLTVTIGHGTVSYGGVEDLLKDMRDYFVPRTDRFEAGIVAGEAVNDAVGRAATASLLSRINPDGDDGVMVRLEREITAWSLGHDKLYKDSQDSGGGDPYRYSDGLFTEHGIGISITRTDDDKFHLSLQGRGCNYYSKQPTKQIDDFAAFVGKDIAYGGDIKLTYTGQPPTEFNVSTLERTIRGEVQVDDVVALSLPVGESLNQLQKLLNLRSKTIKKLWSIIESNPSGIETPSVRDGDIVVGISPYHRLPRQARRSADSTRLEGYSTIVNNKGREERYFFLPELGVHVQSTDPTRQAELSRMFHAIGTVARNSTRRSYNNGYVGGPNSFKPNVAI